MKGQKAFSLVEALVALFVGALVVLMATQFCFQFMQTSHRLADEVRLRDQLVYGMNRMEEDIRESEGVCTMRHDDPLRSDRLYLKRRIAVPNGFNFGESQWQFIEYGLNWNSKQTAEDRSAGAYVLYRRLHLNVFGGSDRQPLNAGMVKEGLTIRYLDASGQETRQAAEVAALSVTLTGQTSVGQQLMLTREISLEGREANE